MGPRSQDHGGGGGDLLLEGEAQARRPATLWDMEGDPALRPPRQPREQPRGLPRPRRAMDREVPGIPRGDGAEISQRVSVTLEEDIPGAPGKLCLRRIRIRSEDGRLLATTHTHQGSGNMHSMVAHNGLTLLPPGTDGKKGEIIEAVWIL